MTFRPKKPTGPSLVMEALTRADDFMTVPELMQATGQDRHHVQVALAHLHGHKAVDFVEAERTMWWYATPNTDQRCRTVAERAGELKPRKGRKVYRCSSCEAVFPDREHLGFHRCTIPGAR